MFFACGSSISYIVWIDKDRKFDCGKQSLKMISRDSLLFKVERPINKVNKLMQGMNFEFVDLGILNLEKMSVKSIEDISCESITIDISILRPFYIYLI